MVQDNVISPDMSVSNHKSMCNIQEEDRPHNFFPGILQNILLIIFHSVMARGTEQMFKFCGESPGIETGQFKHRILCLPLPSGPSFVCGEWRTMELTICSRPPLSVSYLPPSQTLPQCNSRLKYWLLRHCYSKCSPRTLYVRYTPALFR